MHILTLGTRRYWHCRVTAEITAQCALTYFHAHSSVGTWVMYLTDLCALGSWDGFDPWKLIYLGGQRKKTERLYFVGGLVVV